MIGHHHVDDGQPFHEGATSLRIGARVVGEEMQAHALFREGFRRVERAAAVGVDVVGGPFSQAHGDHPLLAALGTDRMRVGGRGDRRAKAQRGRHLLQRVSQPVGQAPFRKSKHRLDDRPGVLEAHAARVALLDGAQQLVPPMRPRHQPQFVQQAVLTGTLDRQRESQRPVRSHQSIPVDPARLDVVHVVEQDEPVDRTDQLEVAQVREGVRLHDRQFHVVILRRRSTGQVTQAGAQGWNRCSSSSSGSRAMLKLDVSG